MTQLITAIALWCGMATQYPKQVQCREEVLQCIVSLSMSDRMTPKETACWMEGLK